MSETLTAEEQRYFDTRGAEPPTVTPAPAPEQTPQATTPSPAPAPAAEPPEQRQYVPLPEHMKEKDKRRALESTVEELRRKLAELDGRTQTIGQPPKPAEPQIPEFGQDPEAWIKAQVGMTRKEVEELKTFKQNLERQQAYQAQVQQVFHAATAQEQEFAQQTKDYFDAANYLRTARSNELAALGYNQAQIAAAIQQDTLQLAAQALHNQRNFGDVVYQIAKSRGWAPKPVEEPKPAPVATPAPITPTDIAKLATIQKGQERAVGLGSAGSAPKTEITAEDLLNMTERQYAKFAEENPEQFRRLLGG